MSTTLDAIWNEVLDDLKANNDINNQTFTIWLKDTKALDKNKNNVVVSVPDETAKKHIETSKLHKFINASLIKIIGEETYCSYVVDSEEVHVEEKPAPAVIPEVKRNTTEQKTFQTSIFNPNYTFNTFIIGPNNELVHAAAESIAKNPAGQYNPLFIYGESGLGKTHIIQAIGNTVLKEKPHLKVLYVTSEQFISEFIQSITSNTTQSLKIKYRNVDVLLIDDIQFLANKEQTQTEFFNTFNDLHINNKQIVLTSDRPPRELSNLTDRLRTRFEGGLLADIKAPNLETREAILRKKAQVLQLDIEDEIISYLAKRIKSNIRLLESALNKLHAITNIKKGDVSLEMVKQYLKPLFEEQKNKELTVEEIISKVSDKFNVTVDNIKSKSRHASIIQPRFISMYLCTQLTRCTTKEIGKEIGNRDHSTVINARNNIKKLIEEDEIVKETIEDIISELRS